MRISFLLLLVITFSNLISAQENTSLLCADGIDNDGDGLIDCDDSDCILFQGQGCEICSDGISFADEVIEYVSGCELEDNDPTGALGVSDYGGAVFDVFDFVFLGEGGHLKLAFIDNQISNSGDSGADVYIFEVGPAVEPLEVGLRPADDFTRNSLVANGFDDPDGDDFYYITDIGGSTSSVDIDNELPGFSTNELKFDAIILTDIPDGDCVGTTTVPGADIDAVCALSFVVVDCAGTANGTAILDECGVCLEPTDPEFNQSCIDCNGVVNGTAILDDCGICLEENDPAFNQSCIDCNGVLNGTAILDDCGICLEENDPAFNQSCLDCNGIANGTAILDDCGVCLEENDPAFNQSCVDCNGVVNGTSVIDTCGVCLEPTDPEFNQSCAECFVEMSTSIDLCEGDSYTYNGEEYSEPGVYVQESIDEDGCTVTTEITVREIYSCATCIFNEEFTTTNVEIFKTENNSFEFTITVSNSIENLTISQTDLNSFLIVLTSEEDILLSNNKLENAKILKSEKAELSELLKNLNENNRRNTNMKACIDSFIDQNNYLKGEVDSARILFNQNYLLNACSSMRIGNSVKFEFR